MASISLREITKVYGKNIVAVKNLDLEIRDEEFIVLVGPSGCGKSTLLRMIAGLEEISSGELLIDGVRNNETAPGDRDIAMVFQSYALYPHMTAYQNMAFGLVNRKVPKERIDELIRSAAEMLDIEELLSRKPREMSGGQRQRVALGRALVREPAVFLLDEPLSNLDAKLRSSMRAEIIKLHNKLRTTFVYVTHDQTEAMTMGDRIVVMKDGVIQQVGTAKEVYHSPANQFVACFIGTPQMNILDAVVRIEDGTAFITPAGAPEVKLCRSLGRPYLADGQRVTLGVRPEHVVPDESGALSGEVEVVETLGNESFLYLDFLSRPLTLRINGEAEAVRGSRLSFSLDEPHIHLFDPVSQLALPRE